MTKLKTTATNEEREIIEKINEIVLLKIKTIIVKNLKKEDIPEFKKIVEKENLDFLLTFARKKVPYLSKKIYEEMELLGRKIIEETYD